MSTKKSNSPEVTREANALANFIKRREAASPAPQLKIVNGKITTSLPESSEKGAGMFLLMEALGTADFDFSNGLLSQLAHAGSTEGQVDEAKLNFMVSVIKDIRPVDQLETMLAAQMAATHMAAMTFARRLAHVEDIRQQDSAVSALTKLTRTFAMQMETLKRYRTSGEQKVTVQHVSVGGGGQAIVGNVTQAARDSAGKEPAALPPPSSEAQMPPLTILEKSPRAGVLRQRQRRE